MDCEYTERSCEEEAELKWSTKKVKENTPPPHPGGSSSYREKLIGGMPGAFIQAFNLDSTLEEDPESDSEVDEITEGVAVVKLSKESKLRIRSKWAHTLIIKVFGRTVGFHFLHAKVMSLWKPFGRLEFVDLGKDFFLIRFGLVEDFNKVLRGGPWFIGEHYLTIRPWVPNFIPSEANCSSVAVWIRLPKLPLEYYEESVLKDIGKAIGPVLRIDTQTASEAKGRYARLCVQVDLDQPLIRTVRLGTLSRPMLYEGISSLCFSCGRLGHRKDNCVYTAKEMDVEIVTEDPKMKDKTSFDLLDQKDEDYGPWLLVNRRKSGPRPDVKHASRPYGGMRYQGSQGRDNPLSSQTLIASPKEGNSSRGTSKGKRKLGEKFSYRNANQSHVDTCNGMEPLADTLETEANIGCTLTNVNVSKSNFVFSTGKPSDSYNNSDHSSEKGHQVRNSSSSKSGHGGSTRGSTVGNQTQRKDNSHPIRGPRSDQGKPNSQHGMARPRSAASMEVHLSTNKGESSDRNQFATLSEASYEGNKGLYGCPLKKECTSTEPRLPPPIYEDYLSKYGPLIDWNYFKCRIEICFLFLANHWAPYVLEEVEDTVLQTC